MLLWYRSQRGLYLFAYGPFTLCGTAFLKTSAKTNFVTLDLPQPRDESRFGLCPRSLAATCGINVFLFSCRYLDVSVPCVRPDGL